MKYSSRPPFAGDCLAGDDMACEREKLRGEPTPEWAKSKNKPCLCTASYFRPSMLKTHTLPSDGVLRLMECSHCHHTWVHFIEG